MTEPVLPTVIFLSGDLVFAGRLKSVCEPAGARFLFGANLPDLEAEQADAVRLVVLDLGTRSGLTGELVPVARERFPGARLVAYAPHVHKGRLEAARQAGFDDVLTRGQFDAWLPRLGQSLLGSA
jgi:hypothetical protein